ncbi:unnamed protein product [Mytilus edulis]|uniref:Uncharacterized protein n=1 Tax=Mytilus edulis TaxID=6550 RepID=A0A8S3UCA4_MYTED|nr:unnamed protein product [Mytilus edulis]
MVSSACTGSGFPVDWTNVTDATYWFYSSAYRRQFTAGYKITDYNTTTGLAIGASPTCQDDFYNSTTGYYYYRIRYDDRNIYSLDMIPVVLYKCHGYKKYGNVIREYIGTMVKIIQTKDQGKVQYTTPDILSYYTPLSLYSAGVSNRTYIRFLVKAKIDESSSHVCSSMMSKKPNISYEVAKQKPDS